MPDSKFYSNPYVTKSIKYINDNIKRKLTIEELCENVHLSKFYFLRIFKKETGITPYRYILDCKIENIRNDLYNGLDINTLVSKYEFYDLRHLNKSFIKIYGITPLEYIKINKNGK